jgi:hypothetical protein
VSAFKIGECVTWTSQSAGVEIAKVGTVKEIVPAGSRPIGRSKFNAPGGPRDHESYIVRVRGRGLYWPRVAGLRPFPSPRAAAASATTSEPIPATPTEDA